MKEEEVVGVCVCVCVRWRWGWGCLAQAPDTKQKFTGREDFSPLGSPSPSQRGTGWVVGCFGFFFLHSTQETPLRLKLPQMCRTRNPAPLLALFANPSEEKLAIMALELRESGLWLLEVGNRVITHMHTKRRMLLLCSRWMGRGRSGRSEEGEKCFPVRGF